MSKAQCRNCGDIVESRHRHDFVSCKCYKDSQACIAEFEELHPEHDEQFWDFVSTMTTGFYLDGGNEYLHYGGKFEHIKWIEDDNT